MKLKDIYIVFENCEEIFIPATDIDGLNVKLCAQHVELTVDDEISETFEASETFLILKKSANITYYWFDNKLPFDRILTFRDIVGIQCEFDDGSVKYFTVPWEDGKSDYDNKLQKTELLKNGNLMIFIGKISDEEWKERTEFSNILEN